MLRKKNWNKKRGMLSQRKQETMVLAHSFANAAPVYETEGTANDNARPPMQTVVFVEATRRLFALHRLLPLRRRYIVNRNNRVRLRYVTGAVAAIMAVCVVGASQPAAFLTGKFSEMGGTALTRYSLAMLQSAAGSEQQEILPATFQERISDGIRKASVAIQKAPERKFEEKLEIGDGDTLAGVLQEAGINGQDSYNVIKAASEYIDPRDVRPGQKLSVHFRPVGADATEFSKMVLQVDPIKEVIVRKKNDEFVGALNEKELIRTSRAGTAKIETSLYGSAARSGIPSQVIAELIRVYSWNIDFQRDIQPGDKIEVLYEADETADGNYARYGNILYANLTVNGKDVVIYRFMTQDGRVDYFQPNGMSVRNTLMKTPIDGARISSGFGMRHHPVLGYNKMHKGVDFAAPTGTPIYAAGDGILEHAGRFSSYGNYIRIRHNSQLKTAYGHLSRLGKGMASGKRVSQGDVIGYVGSTGRATGPHLHYEVMLNNKQVNPKSVNLPTGEQLAGKELKKFKDLITGVHQQYVSLAAGQKYAQTGAAPSKNLN